MVQSIDAAVLAGAHPATDELTASERRARAIEASALWAAWGDALGFVTEGVSDRGALDQRRGVGEHVGERVSAAQPWLYRIDARLGPSVELPVGCYSDDTQLRLATGRAIRASGRFNVEAFSKVELPIFLSYGLGSDRRMRLAAQHLTPRHVRWSTNFFDEDLDYLDGADNGAATRIQPHVWAATPGESDRLVEDVLINAICTHGHPSGLLGAAFHALTLRHALDERQASGPAVWRELLESLRAIPELLSGHETLGTMWLPLWEQGTGERLRLAIDRAIDGALGLVKQLDSRARANPAKRYERLLAAWGGLEPRTRTAGIPTVLLAALLAWLFSSAPDEGLVICVNQLGSDTDTIASMAGALIGAVSGQAPPGEVLDQGYLVSEARRLWRLAERLPVADFDYPDLLKWVPPRAAVDAVGTFDREPAIAGLGTVQPAGGIVPSNGNDDAVWQWLRTAFGQSLLAKRRQEPRSLSASSMPVQRAHAGSRSAAEAAERTPEPRRIGDQQRSRSRAIEARRRGSSMLDDAIDAVIERDFDPLVIGEMVLRIGNVAAGTDLAAAFAAAVVRERRRRRRHAG